MENTQANIYKALLAAQGEFETLKKTETADTGKFKYKYVDLEAVLTHVLPILHKNGLVLTQTTDAGVVPALVTTIYHAETGESIQGIYPLVSVDPHDPQKLGASLTYARRYALLAMLGIATEDDDAASATKPSQYAKPSASTPSAPKREFDELPDEPSGPPCPICGGAMWDNRDTKTNPKAPDFKCKDKSCDGVIWPSKDIDHGDPNHVHTQTTSEADAELESLFREVR